MPAKHRAEGLLSQPSAAVLANDTAAALGKTLPWSGLQEELEGCKPKLVQPTSP